MVAFAASIPVGAFIGQAVGDRLLDLSDTGGVPSSNTGDGIMSKDGMAVVTDDGMSPTFLPNMDMAELHVTIDGWTIAALYGLGIALVAVSVGLSGVVLLRRRPKDILASMA